MSVCMWWPYKFAKRNLRESLCGTANLTVFACQRAYGKQKNNLSFICGCLGWSNVMTVVRMCAVTVCVMCVGMCVVWSIADILSVQLFSLTFPLYLVPQLVSVCFHPLFKLSWWNILIAVLFFKGGPVLPVYLRGLLFELIIHCLFLYFSSVLR